MIASLRTKLGENPMLPCVGDRWANNSGPFPEIPDPALPWPGLTACKNNGGAEACCRAMRPVPESWGVAATPVVMALGKLGLNPTRGVLMSGREMAGWPTGLGVAGSVVGPHWMTAGQRSLTFGSARAGPRSTVPGEAFPACGPWSYSNVPAAQPLPV